MLKRYILDGRKIKEEPNLLTWAKWLETANRHVSLDVIKKIKISTVFLGIDHNFYHPTKAKPVLFETMVFGGKLNENMYRYCSWEEAEIGHKKIVLKVKQSLKRKPK